jgi:hypothetical protein
MVTPRELAEAMAFVFSLGIAGTIVNFIIVEVVQHGKDIRASQREFINYLQHEVEFALWKSSKKKDKIT